MKQILYSILLAIGSSIDNFTVGFSLGFKTNSSSNNNHESPTQQKHLQNLCISFANAMGALAACLGGVQLIDVMETHLFISFHFFGGEEKDSESSRKNVNLASLLAGMAFAYLSFYEMKSISSSHEHNNTETTKKNDDAIIEQRKEKKLLNNNASNYNSNNTNNMKDIAKLAIPMTLNNLAGGVAGGAAGLSPYWTAFSAFIASFLMMDVGYRIGQMIGASSRGSSNDDDNNNGNANILASCIFGLLAISQFWECFS